MGVLKTFITLHLVYSCTCINQLKPKYEWKQLDYMYSTQDARKNALETGKFIPENNIPMSIDVYEDKIFVTVPRLNLTGGWKMGVPSSLNYIKMNDNTTEPKMIPYPPDSKALETTIGDQVSAVRVRVDKCDRLWVLDDGMTDATMNYSPTIIVYDLKTNKEIQKYKIPATQFMKESIFTNLVVEDNDCIDTYAYAADMGEAALVVYSLEKNESWRIKHHYFNLAPLACDFSVNGLNFTWANNLYGLSLSAPNAEGFPTLYFHPISSTHEFSVSTKYLRNQSLADKNFFAFKDLGDRGLNQQSGASFVDPSTGVLFYSLINMNAIACWNTSANDFNKNRETVYMNKETMIYPSDIKVDSKKNLWILSNKLPVFMKTKFDSKAINFRIFSVPVKDAVSQTASDANSASLVSLSFVVLATWLTIVCIH